jgi:hypothetical protein
LREIWKYSSWGRVSKAALEISTTQNFAAIGSPSKNATSESAITPIELDTYPEIHGFSSNLKMMQKLAYIE